LIDRYMDGETIAPAIGSLRRGPDLDDPRTRARVEKAVLELLDEGS
jgi:hypothetical protein